MAHICNELGFVLAGDLKILDGLSKFTCSCLHLFEESRVLDGDDRLVGESLQEGDLLLIERLHNSAAEQEAPDGCVVAQ